MSASGPSANVWITIALLAAIIFFTRNFFVVLAGRFKIGGRVGQALNYAPLAALIAIVIPECALAFELHGLHLANHIKDGRIAAMVALLIVGLLSKSSLNGLLAGSFTYLVLLWL